MVRSIEASKVAAVQLSLRSIMVLYGDVILSGEDRPSDASAYHVRRLHAGLLLNDLRSLDSLVVAVLL